jgi:hypothetical protein
MVSDGQTLQTVLGKIRRQNVLKSFAMGFKKQLEAGRDATFVLELFQGNTNGYFPSVSGFRPRVRRAIDPRIAGPHMLPSNDVHGLGLTIRWKVASELLLSRVCHIGYCRDGPHDLLPIQV